LVVKGAWRSTGGMARSAEGGEGNSERADDGQQAA
jgi:hypothetical protein